jgi:hypothetical protein
MAQFDGWCGLMIAMLLKIVELGNNMANGLK